jgi:hypothetical protein
VAGTGEDAADGIAALHLDATDIEPAVQHGHTFTTLAQGMSSNRITEYRTMLARHTRPHLSAPAVADLAHNLKES